MNEELFKYLPPNGDDDELQEIRKQVKQEYLTKLEPVGGDDYAQSLIGDSTENLEEALNILAAKKKKAKPDTGIYNNLACVYAWRFDFDSARENLELALKEGTADEPSGTRAKADANRFWIEQAQGHWKR